MSDGAPVDEQAEADPDPVELMAEPGGRDPALEHPADDRPDLSATLSEPLWQRPTVRAGAYAWAIIGLLVLAVLFGLVVAQLSSVVIPLVIALFPAAVLQPLTDRMKARGAPDWLAALVVLLGTIGIVTLVVTFIAQQVGDQLDALGQSITSGYEQLDDFLRSGPFGLQPISIDELIEQLSGQLQGAVPDGTALADNALGFARRLFTGATSLLLMLIALFFYLKDGRSIAAWVRSVFPHVLHDDVAVIGEMTWRTIGGYIQGQLLVALVDGVFIGIGLWILGVDLALALGVMVFFGGLFPIVGATISGFLAALVALATNGPGTALLVVGLVLLVQNLEGQLLQPLILGRALSIHPLAIIVSLAVGGFLLGILGAFLAVPVAAAAAQTIGYLRRRIPG
jgi:predicted PurR-regulated permease PerM